MSIIHKHREAYGRAAKDEIEKWYQRASLEAMQHEKHTVEAVQDLRAVNAERRLRDQRDLDADYRNYIVPV
jgi:hypothetical protein